MKTRRQTASPQRPRAIALAQTGLLGGMTATGWYVLPFLSLALVLVILVLICHIGGS